MAFGTFTLDNVGVYTSVGNNSYTPQGLAWDHPPGAGFKFSPGKRINPKTPTSAGVSHTIYLPVYATGSGQQVGYEVGWAKHVVSVNFSIPPDGTPAQLLTAFSRIVQVLGYNAPTPDATPALPDFLDRLLRGES